MKGLQQIRLLNSRKDLISKKNLYNNINQVSFIKYINLNFSELKNKTSTILGLGFLYLLGNKKGVVGFKSRSSFSKNYSCNLKLERRDAFCFLEKFLTLNLKNILDLEEGFSKKQISNTGVFAFSIKDIYIFSDLGDNLFKFRILKNLNISITFSSQNKDENIKLLQSLGFYFKD